MKGEDMIHRCLLTLVFAVMGATGCKTSDTQLKSSLAAFVTTDAAEGVEIFCMAAQARVAGFELRDISPMTTVTVHTELDSFLKSKPSVDASKIGLHAYVPSLASSESEYPQIWCKLKHASELRAQNQLKGKDVSEAGGCQVVSSQFFDATMEQNSELKESYTAAGYKINFKNESHLTGGEWASSLPRIMVGENGNVTVSSTSLESLRGIPVVGGMHYCKLFDLPAYRQLAADLAVHDFDRVGFSQGEAFREAFKGGVFDTFEIKFNGIFGQFLPQRVQLVLPKKVALKGSTIISPGGAVPALAMRGLARLIASKGYAVYIVHYPLDYAIVEKITLRNNSAFNLAGILRSGNLEKLKGVPAELVDYYKGHPDHPIIGFGHSLGGAILGGAIYGEENPFTRIVLYGTSSFVKSKEDTQVRAKQLTLLFGSEDGLTIKSGDDFKTHCGLLGNTNESQPGLCKVEGTELMARLIPELNHFCIISDMSVGVKDKKEQDRTGLTPSLCIERLVDEMTRMELL